jgi:hypothetical protein
MALAVTTLFFISYLPWLIIDKKKKNQIENIKG